ncbi:MAG: DUF5060 domain-containing protein [Candidatus Brocadiaceae bacterium]|nr:DUF5060 domain-containing protein [Candidatus Brocadiaceae bacterium]
MRAALLLAAVLVLAPPAQAAEHLSGPHAEGCRWHMLDGGRLSETPAPAAGASDAPAEGLCVRASLPGEAGIGCALTDGRGRWHAFTHLALRLYVPPDAPAGIRPIVYLRDAELAYFQHLPPGALTVGAWTDLEIDLTDRSPHWQPAGHYMPWHGYCRQDVQEVGVKFFGDVDYDGPLFVDRVRLWQDPEALPTRNAIYNLRANAATIGRYECFELSFHLARIYDNPFDPDEVDVRALITDPDGATVRVPGFFYQGYVRRMERGAQVLVPMGRSQWKVRFAPRRPGTYTYRIEVDDGQLLQSDPGQFVCVESGGRGFVRRSAADPDYLEFDDGSFYYPIGHNIAATFDVRARKLGVNIPAAEGTFAYDRFLQRMGAAGENFARIWMSPWSFGIEWTRDYDTHFKGLGRYSLQRAWCLDHVLDTARKHGVYIMLLLTSHGELGTVESDFKGNDPQQRQGSPYWSRYGGPLDEAVEVYASEEARKYYLRKVRYIAARWGYATSIMAWEVFNEPDLAFSRGPQAVEYGRQVAEFVRPVFEHLKAHDPSGRLLTTNYWQPLARHALPVLQLDDMDLFAAHVFSPDLSSELASMRRYIKTQFDLLLLVTEADVTAHAENAEHTIRVMHETLWASCTLPMAGTACPWWWVLIDRRDLYGMFSAVAAFTRGEDRRGMGYDAAGAIANDTDRRRRRLRAQCLRAQAPGVPYRALCWIWAPDYFTAHAIGEEETATPATLRLPGTPDGRYAVEVWDTRAGRPIERKEVACEGGTLIFDLPAFVGDVACKVWALPEQP